MVVFFLSHTVVSILEVTINYSTPPTKGRFQFRFFSLSLFILSLHHGKAKATNKMKKIHIRPSTKKQRATSV
jgi:hypothetical protein